MQLADYYLAEPGVTLVPIEHLGPSGMTPAFADLLRTRRGWSEARVALFDDGFARYWARSAALAARTATWPGPRRRHVAIVDDPLAVRPYVQLLNTSSWLVYACDVDAETSHAELLAYLLVHGDRMAVSGEVATAAVHAAAYWFERTNDECAAFADATRRSPRPDAAALVAVADAVPWLRRLRHESLRPPLVHAPHRAVPGTGLLVPRALEAEPPALVRRCEQAARHALAAYRAASAGADASAVDALVAWLATDTPRLLVLARGGAAVVWDPDRPDQVGLLRRVLRPAAGAALRAVLDDLRVVDRRTQAFHAALVEPDALPAPAENTEHRGYTFLHRERRLIAYNLEEPGMERLLGPPLPYARAMLGARTAHEWAHLADAAGWVPRTVSRETFSGLRAELAAELDAAIACAPRAVRDVTSADRAALAPDGNTGAALTRILVSRLPDYRANLLARRFMTRAERETYVRHNVRTLRREYQPAWLWRMLVRYLYEYQYLRPALGLTAIGDARGYFVDSTWFGADFFATGILEEQRFDALADTVARLCGCYAVDESRFRAFVAEPSGNRHDAGGEG
jgi:hypothetical protein